VPHFIDQIKCNNDITVTDPNMTRFMMTLEEAVELVLFAFEHGMPGDIFVQKAPASTIGSLAKVILNIFNSKLNIKIIGTRHAEKLYESLLTREEFANAQDMGTHYRIKADNRDLNYGKYFEEGDSKITEIEEYHSHNTIRLSDQELEKILLELEYVKNELQ
jgi:UDP-glucose 4-epimerase